MNSYSGLTWKLLVILLNVFVAASTYAGGFSSANIYRPAAHCVVVSGSTALSMEGHAATSSVAAVRCPIFFNTSNDLIYNVWIKFKRQESNPPPYCTVILYDLYGKELWSKTKDMHRYYMRYQHIEIDTYYSPLEQDFKGYAYLSCVLYKNDTLVHYGWSDYEHLWR